MLERIQKIMAHAGIASRRKCELLIEKGLVKVNGKKVKLGDKADYQKDKIEVNNKPIKKETLVYILINKPKRVLSTVSDDRGRKTVVGLVNIKERIFPVGRLDYDAEGLLLLTNDGDFANRIIHPSNNIKKTYLVVLDRTPSERALEAMMAGIIIEGRKVNILELRQNKSEITLSIHEGRKHIIKNIFSKLGYHVVGLKRIAIGNLKLTLEPGRYKVVSKEFLNKTIF